MSYAVGLDEIASADLMDELSRRRTDHASGKCDYCRQPRALKPCRFGARHIGADNAGPQIVVLCGSTRFMDAFVAANKRLTLVGSIGESTRSEITYAAAHGKPIEYLEPDHGPSIAGEVSA
jgi:hypothetical protein